MKRLLFLLGIILIMFLFLACDGGMKDMGKIDFKTLDIIESYDSSEGIIVEDVGDKVLVTIGKEFPTPGYSITIDEIVKEEDNYKVYYSVLPPKSDSMQLQVITYKSITIEIDKYELGDSPYNFILVGNDEFNKKIRR